MEDAVAASDWSDGAAEANTSEAERGRAEEVEEEVEDADEAGGGVEETGVEI